MGMAEMASGVEYEGTPGAKNASVSDEQVDRRLKAAAVTASAKYPDASSGDTLSAAIPSDVILSGVILSDVILSEVILSDVNRRGIVSIDAVEFPRLLSFLTKSPPRTPAS